MAKKPRTPDPAAAPGSSPTSAEASATPAHRPRRPAASAGGRLRYDPAPPQHLQATPAPLAAEPAASERAEEALQSGAELTHRLQHHAATLTDGEVLAAVLASSGPSGPSADALSQARRLLVQHGGLDRLARLPLAALEAAGLAPAAARALVAAFELGRRRQQAEARQLPLTQAAHVAAYVTPLLVDQVHEACVVLYLNRAHQLLAERLLAVGGVSGVLIDPRLVFREAVVLPASALIVCHNHPSGNLQPSAADHEITRRLREAGRLLDIELLDHLIISYRGYFSFAESGLLKPGA